MNLPDLWIELLGPPRAFLCGSPVEIRGSRKTRALLAYLLLRDRPASRSHLCELLWPTPDDPRAALRWSLSKLRPLLDADPPRLVADRASVQIVEMEGHVDLLVIEGLVRSPLKELPTSELESAAGRFHGELLEGHELSDCFLFHDWLLARRESVRNTRRSILRELVERHATDPEHMLPFARSLLALDPLEEQHHARVVKALRSLGRYREAREQVEWCRELFEAELGAPPSAALLRYGTARAGRPQEPKGPPAVPSGSASAVAGLFGRVEECAAIEEFLSSLGETEGAPVLLFEGEPGIGKTRLLDEVRKRAAALPIRVLAGRSWEAEVVRPFAAWVDLLADSPLPEIPERSRADLATLIPALDSAQTGPVDEARLYHATRRLLADLTPEGGSLVLLFDDLQWMDGSSSALLSYVTRCPLKPLGVVCAGRPGEFADSRAARSLLKSWTGSGMLRRSLVGSLHAADASALARSVRGEADVDQIVARCGGNPLFVIELARTNGPDIPGQLQEVLADRLDGLDAAARECAQWVAVLGRATPTTWLEHLSTHDGGALVRALADLQGSGILLLDEENCDFAHDLMRQMTYSQLPGAQRSIMHRRAARFLEQRNDERAWLASDIAYHAERGGDLWLAAEAGAAAGERALRLAARDEAYALALRALRHLERAQERDHAHGPPGGTSRAKELALRSALLRVLVHASLGRRGAGMLEKELRRLAQEARETGFRSAERTACYLLSVLAEESGDFEAAQRHSLEAERAGRSADARTRLAALANTARCLVQLEREPHRARELLREAESLAADLGLDVLDIPWGRGLLGAIEGDVQTARSALAEGVRRARAEENHWAEFECLAGLSIVDLEAGNHAAVLERDPVLEEVAAKLGEGSERPFARTLRTLAGVAASTRRSPDLEEKLEAALEALRRADTKGRLAYALNVAAEEDLQHGELESAVVRAREARDAAAAVGRPIQMARACAVWGMAEIARGRTGAAEALRERIVAELDRLGSNFGARAQLVRLETALAREAEHAKEQEPPPHPAGRGPESLPPDDQ